MRSSQASSTAELVALWLSSSKTSLFAEAFTSVLLAILPFLALKEPFFFALTTSLEVSPLSESSQTLPAISPRGARFLCGVEGRETEAAKSESTNAALERSAARVMRGMALDGSLSFVSNDGALLKLLRGRFKIHEIKACLHM